MGCRKETENHMRLLSRSLVLVLSIFLSTSPHVWGQSRFNFGIYGGYAAGNQNLKTVMSNFCCFGNVSGKPQGWAAGLGLTYLVQSQLRY